MVPTLPDADAAAGGVGPRVRWPILAGQSRRRPDAGRRRSIPGSVDSRSLRSEGGKVVDFFQGVLPPDELRRWIDRLVTLSRLEEAEALEDESPEKAEVLYRELAELLPSDKDARPTIGLGRALLAQQKVDEAAAIVDALEKRGFLESEAERLKAAVELQNKGQGDLAGLREAVQQDPTDLQRQLDLAEVLAGQKEYDEALELCLGVVEKNKQQFGDPARRIMVDIFHVLPNDSELTRSYRRRLSTLLY